MIEQECQYTVEDTNAEALASKVSAIHKGYFKDDFAEQFVKYNGKRDIIIHRGYWARVYIVRKIVQGIIKNGSDVQIISLGCGLQTLWFNLMLDPNINSRKFSFIQIDLPNVVRKKIKQIQNSTKIQALFKEIGDNLQISQQRDKLRYGDKYKLTHCDLSDSQEFISTMKELGVDPKKPTLFYCECVLSYINADKVDNLIETIGRSFDLCFVFDYEMYNPNDRFGQMMVKNFQLKGIPLVGIYKYPLLTDQQKRYAHAGFKSSQVYTMAQMYYNIIEKEERMKIQKLQMLDQLQEWNIIMGHYFALLSCHWNQNGKKHPQFQGLVKNVRFK